MRAPVCFELPCILRSLCVLFFAYIKRLLHLAMLISAARVPVPSRTFLTCRGERVIREALPSMSIWFVENLELLTLNTYGLCVFLELVCDMKCGCIFSWSKGLLSPRGAYATAAWLPRRRDSSSSSSGRAFNLDRGDGPSAFAWPVVREHGRNHAL